MPRRTSLLVAIRRGSNDLRTVNDVLDMHNLPAVSEADVVDKLSDEPHLRLTLASPEEASEIEAELTRKEHLLLVKHPHVPRH